MKQNASSNATATFLHTAMQVDQIERALGAGEANEELSNGFHISLKHSDFWLLRDAEWLNDKV